MWQHHDSSKLQIHRRLLQLQATSQTNLKLMPADLNQIEILTVVGTGSAQFEWNFCNNLLHQNHVQDNQSVLDCLIHDKKDFVPERKAGV